MAFAKRLVAGRAACSIRAHAHIQGTPGRSRNHAAATTAWRRITGPQHEPHSDTRGVNNEEPRDGTGCSGSAPESYTFPFMALRCCAFGTSPDAVFLRSSAQRRRAGAAEMLDPGRLHSPRKQIARRACIPDSNQHANQPLLLFRYLWGPRARGRQQIVRRSAKIASAWCDASIPADRVSTRGWQRQRRRPPLWPRGIFR